MIKVVTSRNIIQHTMGKNYGILKTIVTKPFQIEVNKKTVWI